MRIAVCDDNERDLMLMKKHLINYGKLHNIEFMIDSYVSPSQKLFNYEYDFIILDVIIDQKTSFKIAKELIRLHRGLKIVYYSSNIQYCPESLEAHAFAFLEKPLDAEKLYLKLDRLMKTFHKQLLEFYDSDRIKHKKSIRSLIYIKALGRKTELSFRTEKIMTNKNLKYWLTELKEQNFQLCQRGVLINFDNIQRIDQHRKIIYCNNGEKVQITRYVGERFIDDYLEYLGQIYDI